MSTFLRPVPLVALVCSAAFGQAEENWTVARVLQLVEAREQAMVNLEATLELSQPIPDGQQKYHERKLESLKLMAEAHGASLPRVPPGHDGSYVVPAPYRLRYLRGTNGLERIEHITQEAGPEFLKMPSVTYIYDGQHLWTLVGSNATRSQGQLAPPDGRYLGLDLDWGQHGQQRVRSRSLAGELKDLHAQGFVEIAPANARPPGLVGLVVRYPTGTPFPKDILSQNVLSFNPQLGMALVSQDYRLVRKVGQEFLQVVLHRSQTKWEAFKEVSPGLWLPSRYSSGSYEDIQFPKTGTKYPPGFEFNKAYPHDYRLETFLRVEFRAHVLDLKVGQEFGPDTFKLDLPKDVIVRDTINDRAYQTPDMIPLTMEDDMRQAFAASRRSGYGVWIWLAVANVLLFGALGFWLWLRRRKAKTPPASGSVAPTS